MPVYRLIMVRWVDQNGTISLRLNFMIVGQGSESATLVSISALARMFSLIAIIFQTYKLFGQKPIGTLK